MSGTNTLAYFLGASETKKKKFHPIEFDQVESEVGQTEALVLGDLLRGHQDVLEAMEEDQP